jgi:hypothetical protein
MKNPSVAITPASIQAHGESTFRRLKYEKDAKIAVITETMSGNAPPCF